MVESPFVRAALRAASALVLAFIYLPLIILAGIVGVLILLAWVSSYISDQRSHVVE